MPLRSKGFNLSGLQYFAGANEIRVRASENAMQTLHGIGRAIGGGIEGLGNRLEQRRRESAAARERQSVRDDAAAEREDAREWQHAEDRARLTGEWREPGTEGLGVQTLESQRLDVQKVAKTKRDAEDARNTLADIRKHKESALGQMRDLEEMAIINGEVAQHPQWQQEYTSRREALAVLENSEREWLARAGAADGLPDVTVEVNGRAMDVNDPSLRAASAGEKLERAKALAERARKSGSRYVEVQAARMASEAQGEIERAKRAEVGRKDAVRAEVAQAQGEDLFQWSMQHPALAGVPKSVLAQVASAVMAGRMTYAQARQTLESQARSTEAYGSNRGEVENAKRRAQGLPTAGEQREQEAQSRRERFDFGQRKAADAEARSARREQEDASERVVRDIEAGLTRTVEERDIMGKVTLKPVPMSWDRYSDSELQSALGDSRLGPEPRRAVEAELGRRGVAPGGAAPVAAAPRSAPGSSVSAEQAAEQEFQSLPTDQQTRENAQAILRRHGLLK